VLLSFSRRISPTGFYIGEILNIDSALLLRREYTIDLRQAVILLGLFVWCIVANPAYAHKVNVFAYAEGDQVYVQGYFSDGTKAKNSDVTVFNNNDKEVFSGKTNEAGEFTFPTQDKDHALRIVLNAGLGHQASFEIPSDEMAHTSVMIASSETESPTGQSLPTDKVADDAKGSATSQLSEATVRKAVAEGVLPLAREISELKDRTGFSDIVGGIGFIVGILGMFAYFKAKKESQKGK
jgi:nickel transport protein